MTTYGDMLYHLGGVPVMTGLPYTRDSKYYFVDPARGSPGNDGLSLDTPLDTLIAAEDKTVANQHDAVIYVAGGTGLNMTAALTWDKNYTHLVGIAAPTQVAQRARIFQLSTLTSASPLFTLSATGCIFKNFYCFQGVDDSASLVNWQISGGRNFFKNVHFAGGGHSSMAIDGCASLRIVGSSGENRFENCTLGVDTIAAATGVRCLALIGGTPRNVFKDCNFTLYASAGGAMFVEWETLSAVDRYMLFEHCRFLNTGPTTIDSAFVMPASAPSHRRTFLHDCWGYGFTDWDASDRGYLFLSGGTETAGGTTGLFQASAVT